MVKIFLRATIALSLVTILGSLLYYTLQVTWLGLFIVLVIAIITAVLIPLKSAEQPPTTDHNLPAFTLPHLFIIISLAAWWSVILPISITSSVRSPWGIVPVFSLIALGIAIFCLVTLLSFNQKVTRLTILLFIATFFSAIAMAAVVYPIGFGFDPFLHRAAVQHIAEFGTITPKPLYYIGQYALELTLHLVGGLQINLIDRFLLPLLAAFLLTGSTLIGLSTFTKNKSSFVLVGLLLFPLGTLISTSPQGLAYIFCAAAIMLAFSSALFPSILLALAAVITHPIAGIPAIIFVTTIYLIQHITSTTWHKIIIALSFVLNIIAIPALFAIQSAKNNLSLSLDITNLINPVSWQSLGLTSFFSNHFSTWFDALYLVINNLFLIIIILALIGFFAHRTTHSKLWLTLLSACAMFLNFLILSLLFNFNFLISYEQSDYALRALTMTQIFLLPLVALGLSTINDYCKTKPLAIRLTFFVILVVIAIGNIYGAYPRHDNYSRSAGFNTSQADLDAAKKIDSLANGQNYIVLANQSTSAAAISLYGFKTYYNDNIFYYPVPTGGPLYQKYLSMVNTTPNINTIHEAMDLASVDLAYFAISNYWWRSPQIIADTKLLTDTWFQVDDGAITIFEFRR